MQFAMAHLAGLGLTAEGRGQQEDPGGGVEELLDRDDGPGPPRHDWGKNLYDPNTHYVWVDPGTPPSPTLPPAPSSGPGRPGGASSSRAAASGPFGNPATIVIVLAAALLLLWGMSR